MTNLMLYEICVRQRSIPLPVDAERQPVGALRGAGLRPTTQFTYRQTKRNPGRRIPD